MAGGFPRLACVFLHGFLFVATFDGVWARSRLKGEAARGPHTVSLQRHLSRKELSQGLQRSPSRALYIDSYCPEGYEMGSDGHCYLSKEAFDKTIAILYIVAILIVIKIMVLVIFCCFKCLCDKPPRRVSMIAVAGASSAPDGKALNNHFPTGTLKYVELPDRIIRDGSRDDSQVTTSLIQS